MANYFFYGLLSAVDFIAAFIAIYYIRKLYEKTKGATDFWLFLSGFITSLGIYTFFGLINETIMFSANSVLLAAQDISMAFAASFALMSAIYMKKLFEELVGY
jgi:hypothetical protein